MSDYNKRLLGISVGAIFYIIFFLLDWDDLFSEINFNQDRSFLFDVFDTTSRREGRKNAMGVVYPFNSLDWWLLVF
jgi:hypothetical protein